MPTPFNAPVPDNEFLASMVDSPPTPNGNGNLTDLPASEPLQDPVPESERRQTHRSVRVPPPNVEPEPIVDDRTVLHYLQQDQIELVHRVEHLRTAVDLNRQAMQMMTLAIAVACALVLVSAYKQRKARDGT